MGDNSTWLKSRVEEDTPGDGDVLLEVGGRVERERESGKIPYIDNGMCSRETKETRNKQSKMYDDVEIEDIEWNEEMHAFTYPCPCGDLFQITKWERRLHAAQAVLYTSQLSTTWRTFKDVLLPRRRQDHQKAQPL